MPTGRDSTVPWVVGTLLALVAAMGAAVWWVSGEPGADRAHDEALALWEATEPAAYSFVFSHCSGMCAPCEVRVWVVEGEVVESRSRNRWCAGDEGSLIIEDVFAMEQRDRGLCSTDSFEIRYDPVWGFPASVEIRCPEGTADCGTGYSVTGFRDGLTRQGDPDDGTQS